MIGRTHLDWRNEVYGIMGKSAIERDKIKPVTKSSPYDEEPDKMKNRLRSRDIEIAALKKELDDIKRRSRR